MQCHFQSTTFQVGHKSSSYSLHRNLEKDMTISFGPQNASSKAITLSKHPDKTITMCWLQHRTLIITYGNMDRTPCSIINLCYYICHIKQACDTHQNFIPISKQTSFETTDLYYNPVNNRFDNTCLSYSNISITTNDLCGLLNQTYSLLYSMCLILHQHFCMKIICHHFMIQYHEVKSKFNATYFAFCFSLSIHLIITKLIGIPVIFLPLHFVHKNAYQLHNCFLTT